MAKVSEIGDGQPVDKDKLNEIIKSINALYDLMIAENSTLIWKGRHDSFNGKNRFKIVSGNGVATFNGKSVYDSNKLTFGGVKFSRPPTIFVTTHSQRQSTATVSERDGDSAKVTIHISDGKKPPKAGAKVYYSWLAFGPTE